MKQRLTLFLFLLLGSVCVNAACGPDLMFFSADGQVDPICYANLAVDQTTTIEVFLVDYQRSDALTEFYFRVSNWLEIGDPPGGVITESWNADLVTGNLADGLTLNWNEGLPPASGGFPQTFELGTIEVRPMSEDWVGTNHLVKLEDGRYTDTSGHVYYVTEEFEDAWPQFTFNGWEMCIPYVWDPPEGNWDQLRYAFPADGATVPPVFTFSGEGECWACSFGYGYDFWGDISLDGTIIHEFSGAGEGQIATEIDLGAYEHGDAVAVDVHFTCANDPPRDYHFDYTLDAVTAVPDPPTDNSTSFSTVKSYY